LIGAGGAIVTVAVAATPGSATDTAFTVTLDGLGRVAGAEYRPADVIVPNVELPPGTSLTNHVTRVSVAFETVAVKVCTPTPATSVTDAGDTEIETGGVMMIGGGDPPAGGVSVGRADDLVRYHNAPPAANRTTKLMMLIAVSKRRVWSLCRFINVS